MSTTPVEGVVFVSILAVLASIFYQGLPTDNIVAETILWKRYSFFDVTVVARLLCVCSGVYSSTANKTLNGQQVKSLLQLIFTAYGGGFLGFMLLGEAAAPIAKDILIIYAMVVWALFFVTGGLFAKLFEIAPVKIVCVLLNEVFRAGFIALLTNKSLSVLSANEPHYIGPIIIGTIAGCGGYFYPMSKGVSVLDNGINWDTQSAFACAVFYRMMNMSDEAWVINAVFLVLVMTFRMFGVDDGNFSPFELITTPMLRVLKDCFLAMGTAINQLFSVSVMLRSKGSRKRVVYFDFYECDADAADQGQGEIEIGSEDDESDADFLSDSDLGIDELDDGEDGSQGEQDGGVWGKWSRRRKSSRISPPERILF